MSLNSYTRKITYSGSNGYCDSEIGPGWFRFEGSAGTRMTTSCPPKGRCGTWVPGWLNGGHPTVADGQVSRQVCFHWFSKCCRWSTNTEVRNCGSYYVYYLTHLGVFAIAVIVALTKYKVQVKYYIMLSKKGKKNDFNI